MAKFLVKASYSAEGAKGVQSAGGTSRRDVVASMAEGLGGTLESFYFAFGETDARQSERGGRVDGRQRHWRSGVGGRGAAHTGGY